MQRLLDDATTNRMAKIFTAWPLNSPEIKGMFSSCTSLLSEESCSRDYRKFFPFPLSSSRSKLDTLWSRLLDVYTAEEVRVQPSRQ